MSQQHTFIENKKNLFECISQCYLVQNTGDLCDLFSSYLASLFGLKGFAFGTWNSSSKAIHTLHTTLEDSHSPDISDLTRWDKQHSPLIRYTHDADAYPPTTINFLLHGHKDSLDKERSFMLLANKTEHWNRRDEILVHTLSLPIHKAIYKALQIPTLSGNKILTTREKQVLYWCHLGKTNSEIGRLLHISENTVKNHVANIFKKLNVRNKSQAIIVAVDNGILEASVV